MIFSSATPSMLGILLAAVQGGCAAPQLPPPVYVPTQVLPEPPPAPAVIEVPRPVPMPGQLKAVPRVPVPSKLEPSTTRPEDVVALANRRATQNPDEHTYFNAIQTYDFAPGALFQVYTAPLRLTVLALQPGEQILDRPHTGDNVRWLISVSKALVASQTVQHLYIKPTRPDLHTNLTIITSRRTYLLELHSYEEAANAYMAQVQWRYPQDEVTQLEGQAADAADRGHATTATQITVDQLNFAYRVQVVSGTPSWTPLQVFDDGHKTFIKFPRSMLTREAPAFFVLSSSRESQLVNYRVSNDYFVVDRLFEAAELRLGQQDQQIVRIFALGSRTSPKSLTRTGPSLLRR